MSDFMHEQVIVRRGARSGAPIIVAVHSTALGQAIGGCRIKPYPDWRDGLTDALRLSAAMSEKCALAGLPNGGGKTVVALTSDTDRRDALLDVGDVIAALGGAYATGPDVGTSPDDMAVIAGRTPHVFCRPVSAGGSGDSSEATAIGVVAALQAVAQDRFGSADLTRRTFALLGLGRVGTHVFRMLSATGARLVAADVDPTRKALAGSSWVSPEQCLTAEVDILVPAALGGLLTPQSVPALRCAAVVGPANNQLDDPSTAVLLHDRGILWAPDVIVSAGGIIHATAVELRHESPAQVTARLHAIGGTLTEILHQARASGTTPASAAASAAHSRFSSHRTIQ
ncbi:Glu/Leu/Phe/Val dehydrogenase dimerization domain-containing protein [Actinoplanes sp. NPDC051851]|uniref:Glu/Leu/Phe/Val dehydrogenase dimerization domain-containing protein n=1 Tax=Actinoplanes sp. NPDC051851 TaxID=3154753 RepID=UPI0034256C49